MITVHRLLAICLLLASSCASEEPEGFLDSEGGDAADFAGLDKYEALFDQHHLISDDAFFDDDAMTVAEVQRFLESTPYGKRSYLADEKTDDGRTFAEALVETAHSNGMNPLVLLATAQKEAGLISRSTAPSGDRRNYAFGCGCPDGKGCASRYKGLDNQLECVADVFEQSSELLASTGKTLTGWTPGIFRTTLDPKQVNPANRATALLFTYTPWVLPKTGGNWLFWAIWTKYADHLGYAGGLTVPFNEGFIGGACDSDSDCFFGEGRCFSGTCTTSCTSLCPDRVGAHFSTTFCVTTSLGLGQCEAQCSDVSECRFGFECLERERHNDESRSASVCLPAN